MRLVPHTLPLSMLMKEIHDTKQEAGEFNTSHIRINRSRVKARPQRDTLTMTIGMDIMVILGVMWIRGDNGMNLLVGEVIPPTQEREVRARWVTTTRCQANRVCTLAKCKEVLLVLEKENLVMKVKDPMHTHPMHHVLNHLEAHGQTM